MKRTTVAAIMSVGVALVFGELATRALSIIDRLNGTPRRLYTTGEQLGVPYRLRPAVEVELQGQPVRINRAGLRGAEVGAPADADGERILVLGDSVVFGVSVADDETFPARLQVELERGGDWRGKVLNGGVPGYNTESEAAWFDAMADVLQPQRVLLGVSLNDFGDTPTLNTFGLLTRAGGAEPPNWLARNSELYLLALWTVRYARGEHWFQKVPQPDDPQAREKFAALNTLVERNHRLFYDAPDGPAWRRVQRALVALRDATRSRGVPLLVIVFPESFQFGDDAYRAPQRAWIDLCQQLGIDVFDLWPAFAAAIAGGDANLFYDTQHPNAAGHAIAAAAVAQHLAKVAR